MKPSYIIIGLAALLSSCSIQRKCHRLEAKIAKDARYCELVRTDTITVRDTVFIGTIRKDSTFIMQKEIDTFYIHKERLHVQIVKDHDTIHVSGRCDSIFVPVEIRVPVESTVVSEAKVIWRSFGKFFKRWFWVLIVIAVIAVLLRVFKKYIPFL